MVNSEASTKQTYKYDYTKGPITRKIIFFVFPLIATGALQLLFNATDLVVAGRMSGESSLSAVGSCSALINLIVNLFLGLSVGAGVCVAQYIGAKNNNGVYTVVHTAIFASVILGVIVGMIGAFCARPLLVLMKTAPEALDEAVMYMRAYFCGAPALMVYNYAASMLRSAGDTKHPLIFLTISGILNVGLNILITSILGKGYGAVSVGIATAISTTVAAIEIVIYMIKSRGHMHLDVKHLSIDMNCLIKIVKIGIPAGVQGMLFSFSNVIIQSTINGYGSAVVAGNTASCSIEGFVYVSMNSLHQAAVTFTGQNVGAMEYSRIKKVTMNCAFIVTVVGILVGGLAIIYSEPLLAFYKADSTAALETGITRLSIICSSYFLCGLMDVGCGIMRGMGKSIIPMLVSLAGSCIFRLLWVAFICPLAPTDIRVLYISYPVSWFITASVHYIMIYFTQRKLENNKYVAVEI